MKDKKFIERIHIEKDVVPLYQRIQNDTAPIYIWGIGALANNLPAYCRAHSINVQGFFVDTGKNTDFFQGLPVYELNELIEKYSSFSVIIGHSDYEDGLKRLEGIPNIGNVYFLTSLCYEIYHPIANEFMKREEEAVNCIFADLQDDLSRECLCSYFEARINDNARYMFPYYKKGTTYWINDIFELTCDELLLDVGACVGDAILSFADSVSGQYKGIIAAEPDEQNFSKLRANMIKRGVDNVIFRQECLYDQDGYVYFEGEKERGGICGDTGRGRSCPAITIDSLCRELAVEQSLSIIKINFPFSVPEILWGARGILQKTKPKIIIRAGFDEKVLLASYRAIKEINPQYCIHLRYTLGIPQGLTLFAV